MTRINKILVFFVLAGCWIIVDSELTTAQNAYPVSETLPPPPPAYNPIPTPTVVPVELAPVAPISTPAIREYNFEAPQSPEVLVPQNRTVNPSNHSSNSPAIAILYRVEVSGDNEFVLSKVKLIEPLAFVRPGEGVIQAGLFP
ncbi:MAG: hypothetical protein ACRDEA_06180, partial [Microcystaceae cyanobacterium]